MFSLERAAVVWAILERILGFDPSMEMIPGIWSSPLLLASDLLYWSLFRSHLCCLSSLLSCLDQSPFCTLYWLYRDSLPGRQLLPLLHLRVSSAVRKLMISRPPMLTSCNASHMILSREMLKRVGESRHPCRTRSRLWSCPVMPLNRTAPWALSHKFSTTRIILALMLYFLIVNHKVSCHTLSKALLKSMKTW